MANNTLVERELRRAGLAVEAIGTGRQEETPEGHLMATLLDAFAEHEARHDVGLSQDPLEALE